MTHWETLFKGQIGVRPVRIDRADDSTLKVSTIVKGTAIENEITGQSLGQLKDRLMEDGEFTEQDATEIIRIIMLH